RGRPGPRRPPGSGLPGGGQRGDRAQFPAGLTHLTGHRAHRLHRRADPRPAHPLGDLLDGPHRSRGVVVAVHVEAVGQPRGVVQARVVHRVEEQLQGTGHVADVRRGAQHHGVGREQVGGGRGERRPRGDLDPLDLVVGRPRPHRLEELLGGGRGGVVDDQQACHAPRVARPPPLPRPLPAAPLRDHRPHIPPSHPAHIGRTGCCPDTAATGMENSRMDEGKQRTEDDRGRGEAGGAEEPPEDRAEKAGRDGGTAHAPASHRRSGRRRRRGRSRGNAGGRERRSAGRRSRLRRALAFTGKAAALAVLLGAGAAAAAGVVAYRNTPDPAELRPQAGAELKGTSVDYAEGEEAVTFGELHRIPVEREEIPQTVVDGVLAAEQRTFNTDPGVSPAGLLRAVVSGGASGGGSTITQQMARNYYDVLSQERTYARKLKEILISIKVGRTMSRDDILTTYLNTIYFGRNAYGVQAAAQA